MQRTMIPFFAALLLSVSATAQQAAAMPLDNTNSTIHSVGYANDAPVRCALPSKVKRMGRNLTVLAARQVVGATAPHCSERGGTQLVRTTYR